MTTEIILAGFGGQGILFAGKILAYCALMDKKFIQAVKPNGLVLLDNSIVDEVCERKDITEISLPATDLATNAGLNGAANMVLLGRMLAETKMFSLETVQKAMEKCIPPKRAHLIAANMKAIELGMAQK